MNNKIQELTDIIYNEGVAKGQAQADEILAQAKKQAEAIIAGARSEAQDILAAARKESAAEVENAGKELKLHARQAVDALKSEIADVITGKIASGAVSGLKADNESMQSFIMSVAKNWSKDEGIVISTADADRLRAYFAVNAKELLDGGVAIEQVNGQKAAFTIKPADGSYKVNFGQEEFEGWIKSMLRPELVEMLF